ncbi:MAG TPA: cytochrome c [Stellaceae bacterium]|nr:cytochrome c [Stellaceae bacterium]
MAGRNALLRCLIVFGILSAASVALAQAPAGDQVARGKYLAEAGDCIACHTVPGRTPYTGGRAFKLPFGTIYSRNITPDPKTGIGTWSDDDFVQAMQHGVAKGGEHLYPAFPYTSYTKLSRADDLAIKAYLFSLPAVKNSTPADSLSFPYNQRWALGLWNLLFNPNKRLVSNSAESAQWNRGAYLVEALGHCGECHTPRRFTQSLNNSQKFSGAIAQGWQAYNITGAKRSGIGGWTDDALVSYLSTGHASGHSSASGPMAEVISDSLHNLTQDDIRSIVVYLRSIPAIDSGPQVAPNPPAKTAAPPPPGLGEQVFAGNCANCHNWDGSGVQSPYADLAGSRTVNDPAATNLMAVVLSGSTTQLGDQHIFMPPFGNGPSDDELAAVVNFVNGYFGNRTANVTTGDIAAMRESLP